ncbi:MAG: hypothetical protein RMM06_10790 [Armatimonadota bacterium]|nr:hypothetical protein [bacterium]MCS7309570.1 hypothetical protein [Armatimonadota bacterium]MDW8104787.1 hypothetical protein [Armatimonadota bacterium]MDW8291202.1 hypothetical protein [Armatimonadota bacterium]
MRVRCYIILVLTFVLVVGVLATPKHMVTFNRTYSPPKDSALGKAKCAACHVKGKELNLYGKDLQKVMREKGTKDVTVEILKAVESLDSDKDGVANLNELKAGTLPADSKSKP